MYKHLFFLDSKTLDWLTPYILVLASDTIAFNVFVLTFVSVVVFYFLNPMLSLMAIFLGGGYVVGFWLLKWFVLERLEQKMTCREVCLVGRIVLWPFLINVMPCFWDF